MSLIRPTYKPKGILAPTSGELLANVWQCGMCGDYKTGKPQNLLGLGDVPYCSKCAAKLRGYGGKKR